MKRRALIVGIDEYIDPKYRDLEGAVNDAHYARTFLADSWGYEVEFIKPTKVSPGDILRLARSMAKDLKEEDTFLFYFAGHGLGQDGRIRLLLPKANYKSVLEHRDHDSFCMDEIESDTADSGCNRLLIIDACRDDPYKEVTRSGSGRARAVHDFSDALEKTKTKAIPGTLTKLYSCRERSAANEIGDRGLFSLALLDCWKNDAKVGGRVVIDMDFYKKLHARMNELAEQSDLITEPQEPRIELGVRSAVIFETKEQLTHRLAKIAKTNIEADAHSALSEEEAALQKVLTPSSKDAWKKFLEDNWLHRVRNSGSDKAAPNKLISEAVAKIWPRTGYKTQPERRSLLLGGNLFVRRANFRVPELGLPMIWVEPGSFPMGSRKSELKRTVPRIDGKRDGPLILDLARREKRHKVTLSNGFWLGQYPVTQIEWFLIMGEHPDERGYDPQSGFVPVHKVSWTDAMAFCQKVSERESRADAIPKGYQYSLPTEAQWEYACRAETNGPFYGKKLDDFGWYEGNKGAGGEGASVNRPVVGLKKPNSWGFHDMHGNVSEWCLDWYEDYATKAAVDPQGPSSNQESKHVLRGGSWRDEAFRCRSASRQDCTDEEKTLSDNEPGFRLALVPVA